MDKKWKTVLVTAGLVVTVASFLALSDLHTEGQETKGKAKSALERITLTPEKVKAARLHMAAASTAFPIPAKDIVEVKSQTVEAEAVEKRDLKGVVFATGLQFTCDPRLINQFTVGGSPLMARQFSYTVETISWQAGDGWPVYSTFCPNPGYSTGMYYPGAKIHQIVPSLAGQNYFVGCLQSGTCASNASGQICFAVNDNAYSDNRGYFVVTIYGVVP